MDATCRGDTGTRDRGDREQAAVLAPSGARQTETEVTNPAHAPLDRYAFDRNGVRMLGWGMRLRRTGESYPLMYHGLS